MICLVAPHNLDSGLARHLMRADKNDVVQVETYALSATDAYEAFDELKLMAIGTRTAKPAVHAILSPSTAYKEKNWATAWEHFEKEMGLEDQPYLQVLHLKMGKGGRTVEHIHRVYSRINELGKVINLPHIAQKAEKVARLCEAANGERFTSGRWNRAVISHLEAEGNIELASQLRALGFWEKERPEATSRAERAETEQKRDMSADEAKRLVFLAWHQSDDGHSLKQSLEEQGFQLCMGDAGKAMVMTPRGVLYRLAASVASGAKAERHLEPIKASAVHDRVASLDLPSVAEVRLQIGNAPPIDGWRSITGVERSTPNFADPSRNSDQIKPKSDVDTVDAFEAGIDQQKSAVLQMPQRLELDQSFGLPQETAKPRPTLQQAAEAAEAENYFAALRSLNALSLADSGPDPYAIQPIEKPEPQANKREESAVSNLTAGTAEPNVALKAQAPELPVKPAAPEQVQQPLPIVLQVQGEIAPPQKPLTLQQKADGFKANLAGVERQLGAKIRWVDRSLPEQTWIELKDGSILRAKPRSIAASKVTEDTISTVISFIMQRQIQNVTVRATSPKVRETVARRLFKVGILVANPDLQHIIKQEQLRSEVIANYHSWRTSRAVLNEPFDGTTIGQFAETLESLLPHINYIKSQAPKAAELILADYEKLAELERKREKEQKHLEQSDINETTEEAELVYRPKM